MINQPFFRTVRQLKDGSYSKNGYGAYIVDPTYSIDGKNDIRSFLILQKEFLDILEYIEPSTSNNKTYSIRLRNLFILLCTEIESNLKTILVANDHTSNRQEDNWNMNDYHNVNQSHFLSDYKVYLPHWEGNNMRQPFKAWSVNGAGLIWYQSYNNTKHARWKNIKEANLKNVVNAMTGLTALISAQFYNINFDAREYLEAETARKDKAIIAIGDYFSVKFPDIPMNERYDLPPEYIDVNNQHNFQKFKYT